MRTLPVVGALAIASAVGGIASAQPAPIPQSTIDRLELQRVWPRLAFPRIIQISEIPDGSDRIVVVTQFGQIYVFPNTADPDPATDVETYLDIGGRVRNSGTEEGLLGLAFSPDFSTSGEFYVHYSYNITNPGTTRISRFTASPISTNVVDDSPANEEVIFSLPQPFNNHNGGQIDFGPDDYLYIGLGDGGSANDPLNSGQDTTTALGTILRVDVSSPPDPGLPFAIPADNPFVAGGPAGASTRRDIFAYGLRNPYRFAFDPVTGWFFVADVGQDAREEINHVTSGGNYGWKITEGFICRPGGPTDCDRDGLIDPIVDYPHASGNGSIIGGYFYRGSTAPGLNGAYLFSDSNSSRIFAINYDGTEASSISILFDNPGILPIGWGQDLSGQVYVADYRFGGNGGIYIFNEDTSTNWWAY